MSLRLIRIVSFLALITIPLARMHRGGGTIESEKRARATLPKLALHKGLPAALDSWFRDNFGERDRLIRWHHILKVKGLRESPVKNVIVGSDGWLFYAGYNDGIDINDFAGRTRFSSSAIDSWIAHQLERQAQYQKLGARYVVAIVPNKQTLYADSMPVRSGPHLPGTLDAVLERARQHPELPIIDLRPSLSAHRDPALFYATDTHWNANGAFLGAQAIVARAQQWLPLPMLRREDYDVVAERHGSGDLANMLSMADAFEDTRWVYRRKDRQDARCLRWDDLSSVYARADAPTLPRALLLGDSFAEELAPRLADAFSSLHSYNSARGGNDETLAAKEHPDLVVLILIERYVANLNKQ